jgi:hypothetical protein
MTNVVELRDSNPIPSLLQDDLLTVINSDRFDGLSISQVVGVLEFLKWNLINRSD